MAKSIITGATYRKDDLSWTTYRRKGKSIERIHSGRTPLDLPVPKEGDTAGLGPEVEIAALKKAASKIKGVISLGIPTDKVLLRVIDFPSADKDEIEGMVDLKIDQISPFSSDRMVVAHEILQSGEETSRVLIAASQREYIEEQCGKFIHAGHLPHRVDVEILAWLHLMKKNNSLVNEGREILLVMDENCVELVVLQDGLPILFRSMGTAEEAEDSGFADDISEEIQYTLTTLEAEWGGADGMELSVWSLDTPRADLLAALEVGCGLKPRINSLKDLPFLSEGLAQRALQPEEGMVDLSPSEWHDAEASRVLQKKLLKGGGAVLAFWLVAISAFLVMFNIKKTEIGSLRAEAQELEGPASEVQLVIEKIEDMKSYMDRSYSSIECLREVSLLLPSGVELTSFVFKKGKEISLKGSTSPDTVSTVYDFFNAMGGSELFEGIDKQQVNTSGTGQKQMARFTIQAYLPGGKKEDDAE